MSLHDDFLKKSFNDWTRLGSQIHEVIADLEAEIERMKDKKLPEELIEKKDQMVERLINFYNVTDQLINGYRIGLTNKEAEIMILTDTLQHAMQSELRERIFKRLAEDVNLVKERKILKQELTDKINGKDHSQTQA